MILLLPKEHPVLQEHRDVPIFFLAGPIQGARDWHRDMTELLMHETNGKCIVVNPRRDYDSNHPLFQYRHIGNGDFFASQTDWEAHYLELAGLDWPCGSIIFWLELEDPEHPREDGQYARDTRGELGAWRTHMRYRQDARVVLGAEKEFPGLSVIEKNIRRDGLTDRLPTLTSMAEVAQRAVIIAYHNHHL